MFQPVAAVTNEMIQHKNRLKLVLLFGVILALCKLQGNPNLALNEIIIYMILWCGMSYANYCLLVFFIILDIFNTISHIEWIGILIQRIVVFGENPFKVDSEAAKFYHVVIIVTFIFDIIAIKLTFEAYKCFKATSYKEFFDIGGGQTRETRPNTRNRDEEDPDVNHLDPSRHFQGQGMRIGG